MKALIVDDHAVVLRGLREILEDEFEEPVFGEARNAAEAVQRIRREDWDIIVLDITLPGRSGLDVLNELKSLRPAAPALVLSMHSEEQYAVRAFKAGAAGYLTKESAPEELVSAVKRVLSGKRYVSESFADRLASFLQRGSEGPLHEALSDREYQVMCMIASGKTVSEIGADLSLSVKTISTYRARILKKMDMKTNAELTRYVVEKGLVD